MGLPIESRRFKKVWKRKSARRKEPFLKRFFLLAFPSLLSSPSLFFPLLTPRFSLLAPPFRRSCPGGAAGRAGKSERPDILHGVFDPVVLRGGPEIPFELPGKVARAAESAFGGEFFEEKIRCRQHLFGQLEAALRQTGPDGNSACV